MGDPAGGRVDARLYLPNEIGLYKGKFTPRVPFLADALYARIRSFCHPFIEFRRVL